METSQAGYKQHQEDMSHCTRSEVETRSGPCACVFARFQTRRLDHQVVAQGIAHDVSNWAVVYLLVLVHKRWKAFAADAADAFLQGMNMEDLGIDIFTDPVGDVRKRLQRLMNLAEDEVLKMLKSGFGDVRAPRVWYDKAARELCQIGFARHPLDRCSFKGVDLSKSVAEGMERLDGILGLHVDDFIGGGEGMSRVAFEGWNHVPAGVPSFASRVKWLKTKLELGSLHLGLSFPFTGIQLTQSTNFECIHLSLENCLQKVKPIALSKERRQNPHAETNAQEKHQLRGWNGSMNWPVTQLMLYGAASLSIQAANVEKSIVEDVQEANKTLRFLKANAAVGLTYVRLGALPELLLGTYFDGSWATRRDGASQGGYLQFAVTRSAAESSALVPLVVTDWTSKKVSRISRASLDVEAQAGVVAVDALEFSKLFYVGMFVPSVSMQDDSVLREIGMSPVVTDAKALFDAARNMSVSQGLSAANKRTAIDVKIVCERMLRFDGQWYWTNTLQQVSDGLTKVQARERLVEILRRGYHALKFDPTFTAGKKLTTEQRQQRESELHQAAEFGASILL